jgi:hypothetical protein
MVQNQIRITGQITLVGINYLSVKQMAELYGLDVAESKYANQITPSSNIFKREAFKVKNYICSKI